ncbi:5'-3' exonuclease [Marinicella litoralis]|uniref:5'-3' exonuclease n=1 Tax=Marinicella litoralis TaxID=644220 RepID=A0A4R6XLF5_9GAMM|nr:5'-3' exonuclease H3TH domain-containing protein [Marinicella litoralis]TDR20396.1 5'-3' exonuclease [Marinicella litoralis]
MTETTKKPTAFLIDSSVFVFRSYYSMSTDLVDVHGNTNHAVYGFARFLIRFIKQTQPQFIAAAFDEALTTSFRNEIYPLYKANRDPAPADLKLQFKQCQKLAKLLGISTFSDDSYEADDLIGTLHQTYANRGHNVCVVSADKDLAQLVRPSDWWWDYGKSKPLGFKALTEKFGVRPDQVCDFLALAGDQVDNIPGVKGVGVKTAQILLNHFDDLDSVLSRYKEIEFLSFRGAKSCQKKIRDHQADARLSKLLSKIVLDAPIDNDDIIKSRVSPEALIDFIEEMNFGPMIRRELLEAAAI